MANATPTAKAYFTSSYVFGNGTTSTIALLVWQALSEHLAHTHLPMTGEALSQSSGLTPEQIEDMFGQHYYKKYYGFKRFATLAEWRAWAEEHDVLFLPGVHDVPRVVASPEADEADPHETDG